VLEALVVELHANGFVVGDALRARVETLSRPSAPLGDAELAEIRSAVEVGWQHWTAGEYAKAVESLSPAVAKLQASPAVVAQQTPVRDQLYKALIGLAMANKRLGNQDEARQHMAAVARGFTDRGVSRAQFGPEVHDFFRKIQAELAAQGTGSLRIEVDDPAAVIFLDERYEAVGSVSRSDLLPGTYRVYVRKGDSPGRVHDVTVSPSGMTELRITWQLEAALRSGPGFVGLELADAGARERLEPRVASALARLLGASGVVVITIGPYQGRRALTASLLSVESGKPYRAAVVALEPARPAPEALRSLVRFLLTGERGKKVIQFAFACIIAGKIRAEVRPDEITDGFIKEHNK
jgi:hypothetical protein